MDFPNLDKLVSADNLRPPQVRGKWFPIHLLPDLGSDERINIGVGFIDDSNRKLHTRFISSLRGLTVLYGRAAARNFQFLLALAAEHVQKGGLSLLEISPQLATGKPRFAAGDSISEILDSYFSTIVSIAWEEQRDRRTSPHAKDTQELRQQMFARIRKKHEDTYFRAIREQPIPLKTHDGKTICVDLPIWLSEGELFSKPRFGTVVSAWFSSEAHRGFSLLSAYRDLTIARQLASNKSSGAAFVLKPPGGRFDLRRTAEIDQDIENFKTPLAESGIEVVIREDAGALTGEVLEFIGG